MATTDTEGTRATGRIPSPRFEATSISRDLVILEKLSWVPVITMAPQYTMVNAYNLALMAKLAYADASAIEKFFAAMCARFSRDFSTYTITCSPFVSVVDHRQAFNFKADPNFIDTTNDTQIFMVSSRRQILIAAPEPNPN